MLQAAKVGACKAAKSMPPLGWTVPDPGDEGLSPVNLSRHMKGTHQP